MTTSGLKRARVLSETFVKVPMLCGLGTLAVFTINATEGIISAVLILAFCGVLAALIWPHAVAPFVPVAAAIVAGLIDAGNDKPNPGLTTPMIVGLWVLYALPGVAFALVALMVRRASQALPPSTAERQK